jgi:adenylate kinase
MEQTQPLIAFYTEKGLLREIDGRLPIEQVTDAMLAVLPVGLEH